VNIFYHPIGILVAINNYAMSLLALAGIAAGAGVLGATGGAIGAASKNRKAREEERNSYNKARNYLDSEYYRSPLTSLGNKAILKTLDERMEDDSDALENRAAAGGATMENRLAARGANNRTMSSVYTQLLQGEDARRQSISNQRLALDQQHSANVQNGYINDARNWQAWGAAMGNAGMQLGSSLLLGSNAGMSLKDLLGGK
jgi:hypothetical protein